MTLHEAINTLVNHKDLTFDETKAAHDELTSGTADATMIASYLTAMAAKGVKPQEIAGAADSLRRKALPFDPQAKVMEVVGTGGDHSDSFNISTTSMFVIAAAGVKIAKHGNRAASSKSGAADVLEALGFDINATPEKSAQLLADYNFCFLFAQKYHPSMRFVGPARKELGFPTIFNLIGPLANPARPTYELLGVYSKDLMQPMAEAISQLGVTSGMVIHGEDGLDEVTVTGPTDAIRIQNGQFEQLTLNPEDYGFKIADKAALVGGTPAQNAQITRAVLSGKDQGAKRDAVIFNAGVALSLTDAAPTIKAGIDLARKTIDSGAAIKRLDDALAVDHVEVSA